MLPEHHLSAESKDVIKLGMGLTATMTAVVLALLTNAAKGSYDIQRNESPSPPPTSYWSIACWPTTGQRRKKLDDRLRMIRRRNDRSALARRPRSGRRSGADHGRRRKPPRQDPGTHAPERVQRSLQAQAIRMSIDIGQARLFLFEQGGRSIPMPFLNCWSSRYRHLPRASAFSRLTNATVIATLFFVRYRFWCDISHPGAFIGHSAG